MAARRGSLATCGGILACGGIAQDAGSSAAGSTGISAAIPEGPTPWAASAGAGSVPPAPMSGSSMSRPAPPVGMGVGEGGSAPATTVPPATVPPPAGSAGTGPEPSGAADAGLPGVDACLALRTLNPNDVYMLGTLIEGQASFDALAHWSDPNRALVGFPGALEEGSAVIHPLDGTLFYMESFGQNYRFQNGRCLLRGDPLPGYPEPGSNLDPVVPFPCQQRTWGRTLLINPEGEIAVDCVDSMRDLTGRTLYPLQPGQAPALSYGSRGRLLTREGVFSIDEQLLRPFVGLPDMFEQPLSTWRAVPQGFWLVLAASGAETDRELWAVDADAVATRVVRYAHSEMFAFNGGAVAADGALFESVFASGVIRDYIQRRTFDSIEIVYDEASDPLVKLHASRLVTAP